MIEFPFENISDAVFRYAEQTPQAPALISGREIVSYAQLAAHVLQASDYLHSLGIKQGDRFGLALHNSIERVLLSLAAMRIGAVPIELPLGINAADLATRVMRFGMTASFTDMDGPASSAPVAVRIGFAWRNDIAKFSGSAHRKGDAANLLLMILSSGSTGAPKGAMLTHRARMFRSAIWLQGLAPAWPTTRPGPLLLLAPAATSLVAQCLTIQLLVGGPVVLLPAFRHLGEAARELASWEDAICPIPPDIGRGFLACTEPSAPLFPKMRALIISGQPLTPNDKQAMRQRLTPNLHDVYGCSGFGMISHAGPAEMDSAPESVGRPVASPGVEIEIVSPAGEKLPVAISGQLRLRGPQMSLGFFNPEDNLRGTERFADGWYYPGEVAALDASGYLCIKGRIADAIQLRNETIYPQQVEDIITRHPAVAEASVVGMPGKMGVDELFAFIVRRPGFQAEDFASYCNSQISAGQRPKAVWYLDSLPRTGNGKIDRPALRAAVAQRDGAEANCAGAVA